MRRRSSPHRWIWVAAALVATFALSMGSVASGAPTRPFAPKVRDQQADRPASATIPARLAAPTDGATRLGFCGGDDWEPEIATDLVGHVYVVWAHFPGNPACDPASGNPRRVYVQVSNDGGATFEPPQVVADKPGGVDYPNQVDSTVTVNEQGVVFVCFLAYGLDPIHGDVACARSTDHGQTFPVSRIINGAAGCHDCDHEWPAARGDEVYVAYAGNGNRDHFISRSHDGGLTWTEYLVRPGSPNEVAFPEGAVIDGAGNAWFAWGDCRGDCTGSPAAVYRVSKTPAGGTAAVFTDIATGSQGPECPVDCGFAYLGPQDDIAIDGGGTLYLVYQDGRRHSQAGSPPVVKLARCRAGLDCTAQDSWTLLGRVDDKTASGCRLGACYALFPRIEGGGPNQIDLTWMDDRKGNHDHVGGYNVWLRHSNSAGASWTGPSVQVSQYDPSRPESNPNGFRFPYGDYQGIDLLADGTAVMAWGEGWDYNATKPGHIVFRAMAP
jgi:hypothetical protein